MIHVLIERKVVDGMLSTYIENARTALQYTYAAPGFISGETFSDADNPNHRFVLCRWNTLDDWKHWAESDQRKEAQNKIRPTLKTHERVTILKNSYIKS
ncbi:antibiotic biosynthesis monooxygenase family protein [Teredinibacter sp. KSP-S5-2]|uniref:antibiotic biosynthesis monooxygenase family protein n=1 Tax=Teredinibacter sp. KSP-S5-2 TaxID=3034506 RepID=UPI0029343F10|nr:antibiotic biosynthesis monooxygenase family protein [Teredinibacter sp. KSP-S5-2]WNO09919.1 antibiotic biosynthesis monooxygenase [Teredinibacter sp. KSP-S5-2]